MTYLKHWQLNLRSGMALVRRYLPHSPLHAVFLTELGFALPHTQFSPADLDSIIFFSYALFLICVMAKPQGAIRQKRKSRGRGLRATTGWSV